MTHSQHTKNTLVAFQLPLKLLRQVKREAARRGMSDSQVYREALRVYLDASEIVVIKKPGKRQRQETEQLPEGSSARVEHLEKDKAELVERLTWAVQVICAHHPHQELGLMTGLKSARSLLSRMEDK